MDPLGWMSNLLWKGIVKSHVTWNWLLIYFFLVRPLDFGKPNFIIWAWLLTRQKLASRCSLPEHIEEATFYLASVPVVEWLATFNQKR